MSDNIERVSFDLLPDIFFHILSRLPVKTLLRFKSVCKTWYDLIDSTNFAQKHKKMQCHLKLELTFNIMLVTANGPGNTKDFSLPHLPDTEFGLVMGISKGLVCFGSSLDSPDHIVCNPTTRKTRQIPPVKLHKGEFGLVFLGFDLRVSGYEVVRIIYNSTTLWDDEIPSIDAEVYTSFTDNWRKIEVKLGEGPSLNKLVSRGRDYREAVVIDRVFYWKAQYSDDDKYVASFDISKKVFDVIDIPRGHIGRRDSWQLKEIKNELALIIYYNDCWFELCRLNEEMTWSRIHCIDLSEIPGYPSDWGGKVRVLGSTTNDVLVLEYRYDNNLKLLLYDMDGQELKYFRDVEFEGNIDDAYLFTESLTPVKF